MSDSEREEIQRKIFGWNGEEFNRQAFDEFVSACEEEWRDSDFGKAIELWMAGWKSEPIRDGLEIMSWYWRRPPIGNRKIGRLFLSTDQALTALRKGKTK